MQSKERKRTPATLLDLKRRLGLDVLTIKDENNETMPDHEKTQLLANLFGDEVIYNIKHKVDKLPLFSYYKAPITNLTPYAKITLPNLYEAIKEPKYYKARTDQLRAIKSKEVQREFKAKKLDYVTLSGTFNKRDSRDLIKHSGYLCLDIDNCNSLDVIKTIHKIREVKTQMIFTSPSGNGVKWIIEIDKGRNHLQMFTIVKNFMAKTHGIEIDKSGKDISRACFVCHDPDIYINPKLI